MSQRIQLDVFEPKSIRHSAGDRRLPRTGTSDKSDTRRHAPTVALDHRRWPELVWTSCTYGRDAGIQGVGANLFSESPASHSSDLGTRKRVSAQRFGLPSPHGFRRNNERAHGPHHHR